MITSLRPRSDLPIKGTLFITSTECKQAGVLTSHWLTGRGNPVRAVHTMRLFTAK